MQVRVLYFAVLRERLRSAGESLDLPDGASVGSALASVAARHPEVAALLPRVQAAVNQEVCPSGRTLRDGDELALIPPVAGGSDPRRIAVVDAPLALADVVAAVGGADHGAIVTFTGNVRRQGRQPNVARLEYEAYVDMAVKVLGEIAGEIEREMPGARIAIHHRIGTLAVGETAVVIAAAAPHRAEAFEACRAAIERLKTRAPIWKKEVGEDGSEWIGLGP